MRRNPDDREPRAPAIAVWTIMGLLVGVAASIVMGNFPFPVVILGAIGLAFGLLTTRVKYTPSDD